MATAAAIVATCLAFVLAASCAGKLKAPHRSAAAFSALRIHVTSPVPAIIALSVTEAACAAGLLLASGPLYLATTIATGVLFIAFLAAIIRAYALGSADHCNCFGSGETDRVGPRLISRNCLLVIAALAIIAVALPTGTPHSVFWMLMSSGGNGATGIFAVLALALVVSIVYTIAFRGRADVDPLAPSMPREASSQSMQFVEAGTGRIIDLRVNSTSKAQLAIFVRTGCTACTEVLDELDTDADVLSQIVDISVIREGVAAHTVVDTPRLPVHEQIFQLIDVGDAGARMLQGWARRPAAALLATDGSVVTPIARGRDEAIELVASIRMAAEHTQSRQGNGRVEHGQ